jgi:hypothetical protein
MRIEQCNSSAEILRHPHHPAFGLTSLRKLKHPPTLRVSPFDSKGDKGGMYAKRVFDFSLAALRE